MQHELASSWHFKRWPKSMAWSSAVNPVNRMARLKVVKSFDVQVKLKSFPVWPWKVTLNTGLWAPPTTATAPMPPTTAMPPVTVTEPPPAEPVVMGSVQQMPTYPDLLTSPQNYAPSTLVGGGVASASWSNGMASHCPNCGSAFLPDALFCRKCGTKRPQA
eukprot:symbB.v1.2.039522.t1/scaffold6623.1/size16640/3